MTVATAGTRSDRLLARRETEPIASPTTAVNHRFVVGALLAVLVVTAAACSEGRVVPTASATNIADPPHSINAKPDYTQACAPSGLDTSQVCIQVTLEAVDNARAKEDELPMQLPSDFNRLTEPEQLLVAVDAERVDRHLPPFVGLSASLDATAQQGADGADLPPDPGSAFANSEMEWLGDISNALDADYQWMYDDGPGSGEPDCDKSGDSGCWSDRHTLLDDYAGVAGRTLVMGAAVNPSSDTSQGDEGGPSLAAVFASSGSQGGPLVYTWAQAQADIAAGTLRPLAAPPGNESATGILNPSKTVPADPDYTQDCAASGLDSSPPCVGAILQAIDHARAMEGVKAMVLPPGFGELTVPEQTLVAVNLERVDRGLAPFVGLTAALGQDAQRGANTADDPPDPGSAYTVTDGEWAGGVSNGLDADYGWMYDDGIGSGNLDCPSHGGPGCWGHREGILDSFGTVGTLEMGAALNLTGDNNAGDKGGISVAAILVITTQAPGPFTFTWADALAGTA